MGQPRLALAGVKNMGCEHYSHLLTLAERGDIELVALCDKDADALRLPPRQHSRQQLEVMLGHVQELGKQHRLDVLHEKMQHVCASLPRLYTDFDEMLARETLDGLLIVTPNYLHRTMAEKALARDIPVLCEKPLAPTVADCEAVAAAERASKAFVQVGLHMRYRKLNRDIKELLDANRLGKLKMIWCQEFRGDWNPSGTRCPDRNGMMTNWRCLQDPSGGSIVEKLCHDLDIFRWWIGAPPLRVAAFGGHGVHRDRETVDHADILVAFANRVQVNISLSLFAPNHRFRGRYMGLIGDQAVLDFENLGNGFTVYRADGETVEHRNIEPETVPGFHAGCGTRLQLEDFVNCITGGGVPFASSRIGLESVALAAAAELALAEGRIVEIDDL